MNIKNLKRLAAAMIENKKHLPILIWGESGTSKSMSTRTIAQAMNIGFIDLRLGQMEVGDLIGLPRHHEVNGEMVTTYSKPSWFPTSGKGILFLDEINRSRLEVRQAVFQLILDRRTHQHTLPDEWYVMSAANPATENYDSEELYDRAFLARFMHIGLEPTSEEWLDYAATNNYDWAIRALISDDSKFLGHTAVQLPKGIVPTPRSWSLLASIADIVPNDLVVEVASGIVGTEAAVAWNKIRQSTERPIKAAEILDDYDKVQNRVKKYASAKGGRHDLLKITFDDLAQMDDIKHIDNLVRFMLDCPKDMSYGYLKLRFIRNPKLRKRLNDDDRLFEHITNINKGAGL